MRPLLLCFAASMLAWLTIGACAHGGAGWDRVDPRAIAPTPDNPCGNIGVVCLDMQGRPSGMCCYEGETCGGSLYSVGCPAGACCNIRGLGAHRQIQPDAGIDAD